MICPRNGNQCYDFECGKTTSICKTYAPTIALPNTVISPIEPEENKNFINNISIKDLQHDLNKDMIIKVLENENAELKKELDRSKELLKDAQKNTKRRPLIKAIESFLSEKPNKISNQ